MLIERVAVFSLGKKEYEEILNDPLNDTLIEVPYFKYKIKDVSVYVNKGNLEDNSSQYSSSISSSSLYLS